MSGFLENELVETSISKLYLKSDLSDVKFAFKRDGGTVLVPAHKLILASGSSVFRTMFFGSLPEKGTIEIVDATAEEFEEFLQIFYLRKIKLTMDNMEGVTCLADKYDVLDCLNTCAAILEGQLTDNNMLFWGYQLAVLLNNQKLKQFCESKIASLSADIFKTEAFLNCDRNVLKNILLMNELACDEIDIFKACVAWAKTTCRQNQLNENDSKNLKEQLGDCFYLIQFGEMTNVELGGILDSRLYSDMFNRDELLEITRTSLVPNFTPQIFKYSIRTNLTFSTNKNPELVCERRSKYYGRYLRSLEETSFTSNSLLLLGKIKFSCIHDLQSYDKNIDFKVINCNSKETLYEGKLDFEVNLAKGIRIKPQETYKIIVNFPPNMINVYLNLGCENQHSVSMGTNIIINFAEYPNDAEDGGLVSSMFFKQL